MSEKLSPFLRLLARYKYGIVLVVGIAYVGFIDDDSLLRLVEYNIKISDLRSEIAEQREKNEATLRQLHDLRNDPRAIERIARERYFMKADDEDIYVLSDDQQNDNANTTETNLKDETTQ